MHAHTCEGHSSDSNRQRPDIAFVAMRSVCTVQWEYCRAAIVVKEAVEGLWAHIWTVSCPSSLSISTEAAVQEIQSRNLCYMNE